MFRAIVLKELRETRGIAMLALAAFAVVIWLQLTSLLKWNPRTLPFVGDGFLNGYVFVSGALAVALGLRQTLGESIVGTYLLLFHRPATRQWLIGVKLLVGLVAYLICGLVPILVYGMIAATPGVHASPFFWAMSTPAWLYWLSMTVVYFGAFLAGIRPGRWFFSRLFPLAGAGLAAFTPALLYFGLDYNVVASLAVVLPIDGVLVGLVLFVARTRDYS
jgi:hypothetical protein